MPNDFIEKCKITFDNENPNVSITENGAVGLKTAGKALLDLNFMLSSMRNMDASDIWTAFLKAYNEDPALAVVWLFFARDARQGCGERRTFRLIIHHLAYENPNMVVRLLPLISEYGRWDDLLDLIVGGAPRFVSNEAFMVFKNQLDADQDNARAGKPVSLLAKWVYSSVTSSKETRRKAEVLRERLGYTPKQYRKTFANLRKYIDVTEQKMSANEWGEINYEGVPSKAGMQYRMAFSRHDPHRYERYLADVKEGKANMNADVVFPYEIVHAYMNGEWYDEVKSYDETLELKWKNLPNTVADGNSTLVVVDGSGSMSTRVGGTSITCHDVARSLGIYFSERLAGAFKNSFITFSAMPKMVRFNGVESLKSKIEILVEEDDCSNTNIERTFDLILKTAVDNHMKQEEIPANILIVSDMEFDMCRHSYAWDYGDSHVSDFNQTLFDAIAAKWANAGYKLPRLVFWNVCSRTGTIPVSENELGVALVSGFSPMIADMVMSGELDPYKVLVNKLHTPRYDNVWKVVMPS